jgi:hypothetical protein
MGVQEACQKRLALNKLRIVSSFMEMEVAFIIWGQNLSYKGIKSTFKREEGSSYTT